MSNPKISIIIPAHNESAVIGRILSLLVNDQHSDQPEIIVVCNGCQDNTADIARRFSPAVKVIESPVASKAAALNLGDSAAQFFPRIYIDADIEINLSSVQKLVDRLSIGDALATAPLPVFSLEGASRLVRAYYAVRSQLPSSYQGFGGSGVYALSKQGRSRFERFPNITADDAFVRLQFAPSERQTVTSAHSVVHAPRTLERLIAIRRRIYYGTAELSRAYPNSLVNENPSNKIALMKLMASPADIPNLAVYLCVNMIGKYLAYIAHYRKSFDWGHDKSSRAS